MSDATITPDTRISLGGLRLILGLFGSVLVIAGYANWSVGSDMVDATQKNRDAITGLDKTVAVLASELGALRKARDGDGATLRAHIDSLDAHRGLLKPMEARVESLEKADGARAADLRDIDARVRALENEKK